MKVTRYTKTMRTTKKRPKQQPETAVRQAILHYLALCNVLAIPTPVRGAYIRATEGYSKTPKALRGLADVWSCLPGGRTVWIEVKSATGRQSEDQKDFERRVTKAGCIYILAYSVDDLFSVFPMPGKIKSVRAGPGIVSDDGGKTWMKEAEYRRKGKRRLICQNQSRRNGNLRRVRNVQSAAKVSNEDRAYVGRVI